MDKRPNNRDARIDETSADSFPASDPPASNSGCRVGAPRRDDPPRIRSKAERTRKPAK